MANNSIDDQIVAVERDAFSKTSTHRHSRNGISRSSSLHLKYNGDLRLPSLSNAGPGGESLMYTFFSRAFLPTGFPHSVTSDYLGYQLWDTIQGLSSYVRGMLTSQALLQGAGVGSSTATTAASVVVQFFFRDAVGLLGGVAFAAIQGSSFDSHAKQWRLVADIANDVGLAIELAAPLFPDLFLLLACIGSISRAITGVAGGATRMALTQHFALQSNSADIASKESSQETAVTLIGMVLGLGLVRLATIHLMAAWVAFWLLTALHVYANIRALRCLNLTRVNRARLDLLLAQFVRNGVALTPEEISPLESLVPPPLKKALELVTTINILRFSKRNRQPEITLAPSILSLKPDTRQMIALAVSKSEDASSPVCLKQNKYCIVPVLSENRVIAVIGDGCCSDEDLIEAYCVARLEAWKMIGGIDETCRELPPTVSKPEVWAGRGGCATLLKALRQAGWSTQQPALLQGTSRLYWGASRVREKDE